MYFGSTPCNVIDWTVDVSILNTIDPYCTILSITTLFNFPCVIVLYTMFFLLISPILVYGV